MRIGAAPRPLRGGAWLTCSLMRDWTVGRVMRLTSWYEDKSFGGPVASRK
jgi:hypothetical protein